MTATPAVVRWYDVDVDGATVQVMEAGSPDADPLLFLHGWGCRRRARRRGSRG